LPNSLQLDASYEESSESSTTIRFCLERKELPDDAESDSLESILLYRSQYAYFKGNEETQNEMKIRKHKESHAWPIPTLYQPRIPSLRWSTWGSKPSQGDWGGEEEAAFNLG
jgi:hypothetical protein